MATTSRLYDGTTIDALSGATLSGTLYNGNVFTLTNATTGTLGNSGNVGTDSVTTSMGLSGAGSGNYTLTTDLGKNTATTVQLTKSGSTYFFIVTAYNSAGTESPVSNQVSVTAP